MEELLGIGGGAGVDEVADIGVAGGDDSVEGSDDALVALQLLSRRTLALLASTAACAAI